jgi:hypothetical protein
MLRHTCGGHRLVSPHPGSREQNQSHRFFAMFARACCRAFAALLPLVKCAHLGSEQLVQLYVPIKAYPSNQREETANGT